MGNPTIRHSGVITIPYAITFSPRPNHLTFISSADIKNEIRMPPSFSKFRCVRTHRLWQVWHVNMAPEIPPMFPACRKLRGDPVLSRCADAGVQAADAGSTEPGTLQICHGWDLEFRPLGTQTKC